MKHILQNLKTGATDVADVPCPRAAAGRVLIRSRVSRVSLVSAGTASACLSISAGWIDKARRQPDKVRMVLEKVRIDGLAARLEAVQSKLDQPLVLGYCNVGVVAEIGYGVERFAVGDCVASNGRHAEVVYVPKHLCARIPRVYPTSRRLLRCLRPSACRARLANPTLGECVAVTGLSLIGLLTVQLPRA